jgi:hypothetical protein
MSRRRELEQEIDICQRRADEWQDRMDRVKGDYRPEMSQSEINELDRDYEYAQRERDDWRDMAREKQSELNSL